MTTQRLALGTVQFGLDYGIANSQGQVPVSSVREMLAAASHAGIDTLDTAIAYGDSEACLGRAGVASFKLVTKLPAVPEHCDDVRAWMRDQFDGSLRRLGATRVFGLMLHRPEQLLQSSGPGLYDALRELKLEGRVEKIGISIYSPDELAEFFHRYPLDIVQVPFNVFDRRMMVSGWLPRLRDAGVEIHTRSCFLQGLLLMAPAEIPKKFVRWSDLFERWQAWLAANEVAALHACLAFSLSFPEIDRVVVGADNLSQLREILAFSGQAVIAAYPDFSSGDEDLINPSKWAHLS